VRRVRSSPECGRNRPKRAVVLHAGMRTPGRAQWRAGTCRRYGDGTAPADLGAVLIKWPSAHSPQTRLWAPSGGCCAI
jgi:hypothetical protein